MDYRRLKEIVFLLWDNKTDFNDDATQIRIGDLFKEKHRIYNEDGWKKSYDYPMNEFRTTNLFKNMYQSLKVNNEQYNKLLIQIKMQIYFKYNK